MPRNKNKGREIPKRKRRGLKRQPVAFKWQFPRPVYTFNVESLPENEQRAITTMFWSAF